MHIFEVRKNQCIMKYFFLLLTVLYSGSSIFSQENYEDLINLRVDEKYEKLLYKSEKYTLNDKTKKDPLPYLFMSIGYFEISKLAEFQEEYPKAFKNSLKYAVKYIKKDKKLAFFDDYIDFFEELRHSTMIEAEALYDQEKYSKVKSYCKYLYKIDENDIGAYILNGVCLERIKYTKDALESFAKGKELLESGEMQYLSNEQLVLLKLSMIKMAEYYEEIGKASLAKEFMEYGLDQFGDDNTFTVTYDNL